MELSVNVDHVATLRQARRAAFPDPVHAAVEVELGGADGVTVHLRGDRRHIQDRDFKLLRETVQTELCLEMAATREMVGIAAAIKPHRITLVAESPGEVTTQGGLDLRARKDELRPYIADLSRHGIIVGLFLDPDVAQIGQAAGVGAQYIEINTISYAARPQALDERRRIAETAQAARRDGLLVYAGHDINYRNIDYLLTIPEITGYSIGYAIVARALFVGLRQATREMVELVKGAK